MQFCLLDEYKVPRRVKLEKKDFPENPTTSWVIRTLNEEKWVGRVLTALFLQSRLDFEIVIVDSGSIDRTLEIVENFPIRKLLKIKLEKYNPSYALNLGIRESWGKYIGVLSGHSLPVSRTWYEETMKNFTDSKVAAVTGHYTALPDGDLTEKLGDLFFDPKRLEKEHSCKWMTNTNAIVRKDLWRIYPFDEDLEGCEDYDWACEMIARGHDVVKDPAFNVYHSHGGIGTAIYQEWVPRWKRICAQIDKKKRPSST